MNIELEEYNRLRDAGKVVMAVANMEAPLDGELGFCQWCNTKLDAFELGDHEPNCPWRRAREWVKRHDQ